MDVFMTAFQRRPAAAPHRGANENRFAIFIVDSYDRE